MNNPELFDVNVELFTVTKKSKFYHQSCFTSLGKGDGAMVSSGGKQNQQGLCKGARGPEFEEDRLMQGKQQRECEEREGL